MKHVHYRSYSVHSSHSWIKSTVVDSSTRWFSSSASILTNEYALKVTFKVYICALHFY